MKSLVKVSPAALAAKQQRVSDYNAAAAILIQESCYLSPEGHKHELCRELALGILNGKELTDPPPNFWQEFHCLGAAVTCSQCGNLVPPGEYVCDCGNRLEERPALLSKPEWTLRVVSKATGDNDLLVDRANNYITTLLFAAGRMIVTQNLLSWQQNLLPGVKRAQVQKTLQEMLASGNTQTYHYKFCAAVARFWLDVWPWLERQDYDIELTDNFSNKEVFTLIRLFDEAVAKKANMDEIADNVVAVLNNKGDVSIVEVDGESEPKAKHFTIDDVLRTSMFVDSGSGGWIIGRVPQEWMQTVMERYNPKEVTLEDLETVLQV